MNAAVSFTVNVCNSDAPYLEPTLRHMMRQLNFPFAERIATYDPGRQEGKYAERIQGTQSEVERILDRLLADGVIDRVDVVPWTEDEQQRILQKYFGGRQVDLKDFSGAPIYQYLYAMDACRGDYLFHVDSDMLFYRAGERSWIYDGLDLLARESRVVVATPQGGPPQARNWLERLTGRSFEPKPKSDWHRADFVSTRYFLMDVARFHACLPLEQAKPGEPLENSFSHTFARKDYARWSMNGYAHWAIHPWRHDANYVRHLDDLIWAVENGLYPFRRTGFQWDMRTEGEHIEEWLAVLRKHGRGWG
ncbi:glycosyltransferase family 2 protein [Thiobacillus sp.]|uniref:glycosyltransferase family 2 protein n=1 Tax=Thiobacillus sp. TaxID=924 RepID=UPI0025D4FCA3|nr:glycosyltransferase family 2 protein [Thiobacillus sp.]